MTTVASGTVRRGTSGLAADAVAVIIPAHNAEATISATLASIAGQSLVPSSVVVVNDASSDETVAAARRWGDLLNIDVVSLGRNVGAARARDAAIRRTDRPLLALADADDVWLPDHLEVMTQTFAHCPGLVTASALRWLPGERLATHGTSLKAIPSTPRLAILERNFVFGSTLFSRTDYDRAGGFRERFPLAEDRDLWIRMLRHGVAVSRTSHPTLLYRLSRGSLSVGDRGLDAELRVLRTALQEVEKEDERVVIARTIRRYEARRHLVGAYAAARSGHFIKSRLHALKALAGSKPVALRAALIAVAPRRTTAMRDSRRFAPDRWIKS